MPLRFGLRIHAYNIAAATVSTSVAVAFMNPILLKIVTRSAGNNVMKNPWAIPPMIAPLRPPTALPKIPAVPPAKKFVSIPGRIIASPNAGSVNIAIIVPIVVVMNPKITAFGEYGKNTGQSNAGIASGTNFMAIPLKAGTISPSNKRTPANNTYTPTTNWIACRNANIK